MKVTLAKEAVTGSLLTALHEAGTGRYTENWNVITFVKTDTFTWQLEMSPM